jgi:hypothetical protein
MIEFTAPPDLSHATFSDQAGTLSIRRTRIIGMYRVTDETAGAEYLVNFFVRKTGERFSSCGCGRSVGDVECRHLTSAACFHLMVLAWGQPAAPLRRNKRAAKAGHVRRSRRPDHTDVRPAVASCSARRV